MALSPMYQILHRETVNYIPLPRPQTTVTRGPKKRGRDRAEKGFQLPTVLEQL